MNVKIGVVLGLAVVILVVVSQALFTVDEREQVIIIQLGEYIRSIDEPGLHFRLPFIQSVQRLERRVLLSDVPATEFLTLDKERLVIDSYTRWRIIDPHLFFKAVRDERGAKLRIDGIVISKLREQLAEHVLWDIIGPQREPIMETVARHVDGITQREFGIKVIDVRMKRVDLPEEVQRAVFARMVAERERIAKEHRAEGAQAARKLVAAADREVVVLRAEAE
ncbi:protease modulator HflC, partial [candidate division NPL-UPA2 bacterium]|nr:protease modulator HflC [candidate division NPL-UPA2 bacterium]